MTHPSSSRLNLSLSEEELRAAVRRAHVLRSAYCVSLLSSAVGALARLFKRSAVKGATGSRPIEARSAASV